VHDTPRLLVRRRGGESHRFQRRREWACRFAAQGNADCPIEEEILPERAQKWEEVKALYPGLHHEAAVSRFLIGQGFPELAEIVRVHGLTLADATRVTIEQRLLYYADKRVKIDEVVSLEERLRDFTERYSHLGKLRESDAWYDEARKTERSLFPDGPPF